MSTPSFNAANADTRSVVDNIRRIVRALRVSSREAEKRAGLSGAQLFVLQKLAEAGTAISVNELADRTLTHQSSVSVVVQRLVRRGLVVSRQSSSDGRRMELILTARGRKVLREAPGAAQDRLFRALQDMPARRRKQLAQLLSQLVQHTGITDEFPSLFFEEDSESETRPKPKKGKA